MPRDPIKVLFDATCPVEIFAWQATFGDWDLGDPMGLGPTPEAAIEDLHWAVGDDDDVTE
jgi:hypothetical protein